MQTALTLLPIALVCIILGMGINLDRLNAKVEKLEAAVRELNPGLDI